MWLRASLPFFRAVARRWPLSVAWLSGCATVSSDLARAQRAYESGEDDRAVAVLRALEPDVDRLPRADRARYDFLRGMADYRLGYKADARHWLALASTAEQSTPGSLPPDWSATLNDSLHDLNAAVYRGGVASLFESTPPSSGGRSVVEAADESSGILENAPSPAPDSGP